MVRKDSCVEDKSPRQVAVKFKYISDLCGHAEIAPKNMVVLPYSVPIFNVVYCFILNNFNGVVFMRL